MSNMNDSLDEGDASEDLTTQLGGVRQASNHTRESVDDVVFGNLTIHIKDIKSFKLNGLTLSMRVVYPSVYQTAIPAQSTSKPLGHSFELHNITTEGTLVLEFFKGALMTLRALNKVSKALSKRVGLVKINVNRLPEGDHSMWVPIKSDKDITDFGVPQLQVLFTFNKKTSVTIEDFELLKLLGRGKFGKVFMCQQRATGKVYAVKMIRKQDLNSNAVDIHHTLVERLILSSVEHPFICNLKFAFQDAEKVYFVLQYIEGGELMYHVHATGRPLEHARVVFYTAELVLALDYLHSRRVIYRDLKPENVLIDKDGHVRLTDFGLSKISKEKTHSICGTPQFLAPEMILYAKSTGYDTMVDWWALGIVVHEMASCELPFDDENHQQLYRKIVYEQPQLPAYFTQELASLLDGFLTKDPARRLGTDVEELKAHAFFNSINWLKLECKEVEPPFVPKLKKATDTAYFYKSFTTAEKKDSVALVTVTDETQERFRNFSFTNLTELTGDAAKDGTLGDDTGDQGRRKSGNTKNADGVEEELVLNPLLMKLPVRQPDYVITYKNPLLDKKEELTMLLNTQRHTMVFKPAKAPPTQLSVHPWPQLMAESPEHASWGPKLLPESRLQQHVWEEGQPSQCIVVGRSLRGWPLLGEGPFRQADPFLSYVLWDDVGCIVHLFHGPRSNHQLRARATRIALELAEESSSHVQLLCDEAMEQVAELHSAPPEEFPRDGRFGPVDGQVMHLCDGRDGASIFVWLPMSLSSEEEEEMLEKSNVPLVVERQGKESALFRAQFRVNWPASCSGDYGIGRDAGAALWDWKAQRGFQMSCRMGDPLRILGEGEVPHWAYGLNLRSGSRGVFPLSVLETDGGWGADVATAEPVKLHVHNLKQKDDATFESPRSARIIRATSGNTIRSNDERRRSRSTATPRGTVPEEEGGASFPGIRLRLVDSPSGSTSGPSSPKSGVASPRSPRSPGRASGSASRIPLARSKSSRVARSGRSKTSDPELSSSGNTPIHDHSHSDSDDSDVVIRE